MLKNILSVGIITTLSLKIWVCLAAVASKNLKSREILRKFELIAVQGHRSWHQSKAHMQLSISHSGVRISYRFRDIDTFRVAATRLPHAHAYTVTTNTVTL